MARSSFQIDRWYAARLARVLRRPIENEVSDNDFAVLRLEFEIYVIADESQKIFSRAELASRDIVVGPVVQSQKDPGLAAYVNALAISHPDDPGEWEKLAHRNPWIKLKFLPADRESTGRNPFGDIQKFSIDGYQVLDAPFCLAEEWVSPQVAAQILKVSEATIRRRAKRGKELGFENLEKRTKGNHRRLNISLLSNLWEQLTPHKSVQKN